MRGLRPKEPDSGGWMQHPIYQCLDREHVRWQDRGPGSGAGVALRSKWYAEAAAPRGTLIAVTGEWSAAPDVLSIPPQVACVSTATREASV